MDFIYITGKTNPREVFLVGTSKKAYSFLEKNQSRFQIRDRSVVDTFPEIFVHADELRKAGFVIVNEDKRKFVRYDKVQKVSYWE